MASEKGFTLIELVITLVLLGILSATALPKFFASSYQQQVFFDDTLAAVRYAQKLAVATGCNVQVSIEETKDTYTLRHPADRSVCSSQSSADFTGCTNTPPPPTDPKDCPTDFTCAIRHPGTGKVYCNNQKGVSLTASSTSFYFTALGEASTDVTITVAGNKFYVVAGTGFVYE
jgi:MSHA pilin protein MshC